MNVMQSKNEVEFLTWFHVIQEGVPAWGFAADDEGIILKCCPTQRWMLGEELKDVRDYFLNTKATVINLFPNVVKVMP
jgi:hypothetical protein